MEFLFLASFTEILQYAGYVLIAVLVLLAMITVHEFGHYITGKMLGFGIEEFAIGFGPKLFSKTKKNGEIFSVRLFPLGGFCAFLGEDKDEADPKAFNNRKPWQRLIVLVSGAAMNYIFALLLICVMFGGYGTTALMAYEVSSENPSGITLTEENSFISRDKIVSVNGKNVFIVTDLISAIEGRKAGETVPFEIVRKGEKKNIEILLRADASFYSVEDLTTLCRSLGIKYSEDENGTLLSHGLATTSVRRGFFDTIGASFQYSARLAGTVFTVLHQLLTGKIGISSLGGTITTISVAANVIKAGSLWGLLNIASFIGVNLAVFNLLPIPALDGSRALFAIIEWIRKKPLNRKVEGIIHTVGFIAILLFAIFVDLQRCF